MFRLFGLLAFPLLVGCGFWVPMSEYTNPVFSDDDKGAAAVWLNFDGQETFTRINRRDHRVQVWLSKDDPTGTLEILSEMQAGYDIDLFFMREVGYVILGRLAGLDGSDHPDELYFINDEAEDPSAVSATLFYDHIDLDGNIQPIASAKYFPLMCGCVNTSPHASCVGIPLPLRVIPNANGTQLAKVEVTVADTCDGLHAQLQFLDALTLEALGDAIDIGGLFTGSDPLPNFRFEMGWTSDDGFAVSDSREQVNVYRADGTADLGVQVGDGCFYPPTTSSHISSNGQHLWVEDDQSGELQFDDSGDDEDIFGCDVSQ